MSAQQNLVPNGSFEDYTTCPNNAGQVNYANHWFDPTNSSSDYFNSCCSNGIAGIPSNLYGYKNAYDGNAMMGFGMYGGSAYPNDREYIAVKLTEKLDSNISYCFSCYLSLAGSWKFACNGFGICLLDDTVGIYNYYLNTINYSTSFIDNTIIKDTSIWEKIETRFINKKQNARYLIIGNFYNDANITTSIINNTAFDISYYYIDKVALTKCEDILLQIPNVITANKDGVNDIFIIKDLLKNSVLSVFNRWGNLIYNSTNYQNDWQPSDINAGTYYYILQTETETYKGFLEIFK